MTEVLTQQNNQIHRHEESMQRRQVRFVGEAIDERSNGDVAILGSQSLPPGMIISKRPRSIVHEHTPGTGNSRTESLSSPNQESRQTRGPLVRRYVAYESERRIDVIHQWECVVTDVDLDSDTIEIDMYDLHDSSRPTESGDLSFREIAPSERQHIKPGTVLYWSIGYEQDNAGTYRRVSEFRRKRMPRVTRQMERHFQQRATDLADSFGIPNSATTASDD